MTKAKISFTKIGGVLVKIQEFTHKMNIITPEPLALSDILKWSKKRGITEVKFTEKGMKNPLILRINNRG